MTVLPDLSSLGLDFPPGTTVEQVLKQLPAAKRKKAEALLAQYLERQRERLQKFFPDTGPYRRDLYPKHMAFFAAGKEYRERAMLAGNRCLTYDSLIDTDVGRQPVGRLAEAGRPIRVWSWDGRRRVLVEAEAPFRKPVSAVCYRLTMADGQWVELSEDHRVWSDAESWVAVSSLLPRFGLVPRESTSDNARPVRDEDGPRWFGRRQGSLGSCCPCSRPDDAPPPWGRGSDQARLPSRADAPRLVDSMWRTGALACSGTSIPYSWFVLPSGLDVLPRLVGRFAEYSNQIADTIRERCFHANLGTRRPHVGLAVHLQSCAWPFRRGRGTGPSSPPSACVFSSNRIVSVVPIGRKDIYTLSAPPHHNYFAADLLHANSGKTICGAYELTCHLMGWYPHWWEGRRFDGPVRAWVAGDTSTTVRDILQQTLLGPPGDGPLGSPTPHEGLIPPRLRSDVKRKSGGVPNSVESLLVLRESADTTKSVQFSQLTFKSYDQRRESFQGTHQAIILLDEEPPEDIYMECLMRTAATADLPDGLLMATFTPLQGMTPLVMALLEGKPIGVALMGTE